METSLSQQWRTTVNVIRCPERVTQTVLTDKFGYMITYHAQPKRSESLVITFDTIHSQKKTTGFGVDFLLGRGFDVIHVSPLHHSSYQHLSLDEFRACISPYVDDRPVFTYGSSLGGYAAIYYAGMINAKAISISPRCPADPEVAAKIKEYQSYNFEFQHVRFAPGHLPASNISPSIAYDPLDDIDHAFVEDKVKAVYAAPDLTLLANGMHSVCISMQASGILEQFVLTTIAEGNAPRVSIDPLKDLRFTSSMAMRCFREKDIASSLYFLKKALAATLASPSSFWPASAHFKYIELIKIMVEKRILDFYPCDFMPSERIRKAIIAKYHERLASMEGPEHYLALCELNGHLMSYDGAYTTALVAANLYPQSPEIARAVKATWDTLTYIDGLKTV